MAHQFVCVKWGDKYPPEMVNRIFRMISKNLDEEFKLYCVTDDATGLDERVGVLPIEDSSLKGWWHKLSLFKADFYGLSGDVLYLDLDVVIVDRLEHFFTYKPGQFVISKDLKTGAFNSSVFRFTVGSQTNVWESFLAEKEYVISNYHGDQDWITEKVTAAEFWPGNSVVSFKKQCNARITHSFGYMGVLLRKLGLMKVKGEAQFPPGTHIIQFHGKPDPDDVVDGPYDIYKAAPWIKNYW